MLTYRTGAIAGPAAARAMADHLLEMTVPALQAEIAAYYAGPLEPPDADGYAATVVQVRRDADPALAAMLGIQQGKALTREQLANLLGGNRADGRPISRQQRRRFKDRTTIGFVDLCWSAPKSLSVAWALAPTEAERALLLAAHRGAVMDTMRIVEASIGRVRRGKGGRGGADAGTIMWFSCEHLTARPTVEVAQVDPGTGEAYSQPVSVPVPGDPQIHSHVLVPAVVLASDADGRTRVGGLDLAQLAGRIHEWGATYNCYIARRLRDLGVEVGLDHKTGAVCLDAVPVRVSQGFSKRVTGGTKLAQAYAREQGLDWDNLDAGRRVGLLKAGTQDPRGAKQDDLANFTAWHEQAAALGWKPTSVLNLDAPASVPDRPIRLEAARLAALPFLDDALRTRAVVDEAVIRVAAARGLIAAGLEDAGDIDAVTDLLAAGEVLQDGRLTRLLAREVRGKHGELMVRYTTALHAEQEARFVDLVRTAAADRSLALSKAEVLEVAAASGLDLDNEHGRAQIGVMVSLGTGGRVSAAIGAAGSGKTALLRPLVSACQARGRSVYGAAVAWRQAAALAEAGIPEDRCMAIAALLARARAGTLRLDADSVVIIDEISLLSTQQALAILEMRETCSFSLIMVGDPLQAQPIEAGGVVDLLRRALPETIPEITTTIRQRAAEERALAQAAREGRVNEALGALRRLDRAHLAAGPYEAAVEAVANLWAERTDTVNTPVSVLAPTAADVHAIGSSIRQRRRVRGEVGPDLFEVQATDQTGTVRALPLAAGDHVRLFSRVHVRGAGAGAFAVNGSVVTIIAIEAYGLTLRSASGRVGMVPWNALRDRETGHVRLAYGDALTLDAAQGITTEEAILALPNGSGGVGAGRAYVGLSRHRQTVHVVVGEAAERRAIVGRRALGDVRPIRDSDIWTYVAERLSHREERPLALDLLERAHGTRECAGHALRVGLARLEGRTMANIPTTVVPEQRRSRGLRPLLESLAARLVERSVVSLPVPRAITASRRRSCACNDPAREPTL